MSTEELCNWQERQIQKLEGRLKTIDTDRERLDKESQQKDVWVKHHQASVELALKKVASLTDDVDMLTRELLNGAGDIYLKTICHGLRTKYGIAR